MSRVQNNDHVYKQKMKLEVFDSRIHTNCMPSR